MKNTKKNITKAVLAKDCLPHQIKMVDKITDDIYWAWKHWEDSNTSSYYIGQYKPYIPPRSFITHWIEINDFEADGYNEQELIELFN